MEKNIDIEKTADALKSYLKNTLADYKLLKRKGATQKELEDFLQNSFESLLNWAKFGFNLD